MTRPDGRGFQPRWWLRGSHRQSVLPSLPWRRPLVERRSRGLILASRELLLDCGDGVRLQAFHAVPPRPPAAQSRSAPSLVVLVHGWEGSAQSLYILSLAQALFDAGHEVVRLNLRDHGDTHHLNLELFHSCRVPEVVGAVRRLQELFPERRMSLAGFSLGGNFMLSVAAEAPRAGLALEAVIAVSPLLDPAATLDALEDGFFLYHHYLVRKWTRSLLRKQAAWPGHYDLAPLLRSRNLRQMTEDLVLRHTGFNDLQSYLRGYAVTGERLAGLQVRCTVLAAMDDPMIPAADLDRVARSDALRIVTTPYGGHCGFLETVHSAPWVDRFVTAELAALR